MQNYINGSRCMVDDDNVYYYAADSELTYDDMMTFIHYHESTLASLFGKLRRYYKGDHDILHASKKANGKPDNRVMLNYPKKLVDTFTGFAVGKPIQVSLQEDLANEALSDFNRTRKMETVVARVWKDCSIYGRGFFQVYNDEMQVFVTNADPAATFIIYDDTVAHKPLYAVQYGHNANNGYTITLYSAESIWQIDTASSIGNLPEPTPNPFYLLPIVEACENDERLGIVENVRTLVDELNKATSEKANDVDYFADAYLKVLGAELTPEQLANLRDTRIINMKSSTDSDDPVESLDVDFLSKPNADTTQENLINRITDLLYQISMVVNLNDKDFGNSSGVALQLKYKPMLNLATLKSRGFSETLQTVYQVIFGSDLVDNIDATAWQDLDITFQYDLPHDALSEAQTAQILSNLVSPLTWLKTLSIVNDPKQEEQAIEEQRKKREQADLDYIRGNHGFTDGEMNGQEEYEEDEETTD